MKKKIAIMLTLILSAGTFTACSAEEKVNNDIKTSVVFKGCGCFCIQGKFCNGEHLINGRCSIRRKNRSI